VDSIWSQLAAPSEATERISLAVQQAAPPTALLEEIFHLLVLFWTDNDTHSDCIREARAIIHFSGVLGIHPLELAYRSAYDYSPTLSALIWTGRLILLELALPLRAYNTLPTPYPDRSSYQEMHWRLAKEIRGPYLTRGSPSPMGYLFERLQHGRAISKRQGPRTNISWSADGQVLTIAGGCLSMDALRQTIHGVLSQVDTTIRELMLDFWPVFSLHDVSDNLVTHKPGHSFLSDPANGMESQFRFLSRRAFDKHRKGGAFALQG
jgi:hypothetical protein